MPAPNRILIIRPSALGDVCRTVGVLASLRQAYPNARIDWLVQDDFAAAIEAHPSLDGVIRFPRKRFSHWWRSVRQSGGMLKWFHSLRKAGYDLVLDCQGLGRSGLMTRATGASMRVGLRSAREFAWLAYNVRVGPSKPPAQLHTVDQMLSLLGPLGVEPVHDMRLYVADHDRRWLLEQLELMGLARHAGPDDRPPNEEGPDPARSENPTRSGPSSRWSSGPASSRMPSYAVLAPTSRWLSKRWPIDRFAQLVEPLHQRGFAKVIVIGAPSEIHQVREFFRTHPPTPLSSTRQRAAQGFGVIDLVGGTSVGQTMALIRGAGLVIANDSAPLHMAVGFDRPCVGLFGPTDPAIVGPYQREDSVVRGWQEPRTPVDYKDPDLGDSLMRLISTAAVIARIDQVLAKASRDQGIEASRGAAQQTLGVGSPEKAN